MIYSSLEEYEETMKRQYQQGAGKPIETNPGALTVLRLVTTILGQFLHEALRLGRAQALRAGPEGELGIICYATGELKFFEESLVEVAQQEMADEERDRFSEMPPLDKNDVLNMHEFLRNHGDSLLEEPNENL